MTQYIVIGVIAVVVLFVIVYIKMSIDEKKGANSPEKQKIQDIVKKVVPGGESYTAAYGTREELALGGGGRTVTTTTSYWYYAVAFKPGDLYLVPLSFDGGDLSYGEPVHLGKNDLGMVEAKKGYTIFYDKDRKDIMTLYVVESNTKDDKYHPVNIQQKEEAEAFAQFSQALMREVNSANGITDIKAAKKKPEKIKYENKKETVPCRMSLFFISSISEAPSQTPPASFQSRPFSRTAPRYPHSFYKERYCRSPDWQSADSRYPA